MISSDGSMIREWLVKDGDRMVRVQEKGVDDKNRGG